MKFEMSRAILALILPLAICACNSEKKAPAAKGAVSGEVLPGSASDAMLPYDTVRSQPPLAEHSVVEDSPADKPEAKRSAKPKADAPKPQEQKPADTPPPAPKPDAE